MARVSLFRGADICESSQQRLGIHKNRINYLVRCGKPQRYHHIELHLMVKANIDRFCHGSAGCRLREGSGRCGDYDYDIPSQSVEVATGSAKELYRPSSDGTHPSLAFESQRGDAARGIWTDGHQTNYSRCAVDSLSPKASVRSEIASGDIVAQDIGRGSEND
jgi:hypothetical protein